MNDLDDRYDSPDMLRHPVIQVARQLVTVSFLRNILLACLVLACLLPLYKLLYLTPAYRHLFYRFNEDEARRTVTHLIHVLKIDEMPLAEVARQERMRQVVDRLKSDFQLEKVKMFDDKGVALFSTNRSEMGSVNTHPFFHEIVAKGRVYSTVVAKGGRTLEKKVVPRDVVEVYAPIMMDGKFVGAFEIYYDITLSKTHLKALMQRSNFIVGAIALGMMVIVVAVLFKAGGAMLTHQQMDEALKRAHGELTQAHAKLEQTHGELAQAHAELEQRVDERTNDLIQSNKALQLEITQRANAEKKLLDNNKFMATLIDTIPNPVFYKDARGVFLGCNTAYHETLGLAMAQIIGRTVLELEGISFKDMAETYHQQDMDLIQSPGIRFQEQKLVSAQGDVRDYMLCKAAFRDTEGRVAGLVGIMLDITERKKMEKELKTSKSRFDAFMHHLPGLAFMKDLDGRYLFVNSAFSRFTRTEAGDPIGLRDDQLWDSDLVPQLEAHDREVLESKVATSITETVPVPGHSRRYLFTTRFPIYQDDQLFSLGGVAVDVTERTEAEEKRRLLERQLLQSQKMEALGTLAGGIAHDFNNILAGMVGYTQIAATDLPEKSPVRGYLTRVLQAGERAGDLVKQILTFSRKGEIEPTPIQIKPIIKEVLKLVRATLPVTIEMDGQIRSDTFAKADPVQIHQVMMNLCANAGYAMRAKGGKLTVVLEDTSLDETFAAKFTELKPGPYLKLSVTDTGQGIAPEHIERIFDPFFTTKPKGEGTGMGLSVVHGIVTGLGGGIVVESEPGQGARFDIYLPALPDMKPQSREKAPPATGTERILFVDDEKFQTDMLKHMLGLLGYKVQTSNLPSEALTLFEKDPAAFDLMITDMVMPEMTGDLLAEKILAIRPDLPIIMCTGYSEDISEEDVKAIGIKAYTQKPVAMEDLAAVIREVLEEGTGGEGETGGGE